MSGSGIVLDRHPIQLSLFAQLRVLAIYVRRSARMWLRFPVSVAMDVLNTFAGAAIFVLIGTALIQTPRAVGVGEDYVSYVVLGLVLTSFTSAGISGPYQSVSEAYWMTQLEAILLSPSSLSLRMLSDLLWSLVQAAYRGACYLLLGLLFGMEICPPSQPTILVLLLILIPFSVLGIGFLSASTFMLLNAKGWNDPIRWTVITLEGLVCGVYFPISALPAALHWLSYLLPQTYVVDAARLILLPGYISPMGRGSPAQLCLRDLLVLCAFAGVTIPLGLLALRAGLRKARRDGGLSRWV